jgi:hypothetical protein
MENSKLNLTIELVPSTSWYSNVRALVSRRDWDIIRLATYAAYNNICATTNCGDNTGHLNCHEIWEYDDAAHMQTLRGFVALCSLCHHVKHLGYAETLADEGKLSMVSVMEHFMKVNKCDIKEYDRARTAAFKQWRERSKHEWTVVLGEYANLIKKPTARQ